MCLFLQSFNKECLSQNSFFILESSSQELLMQTLGENLLKLGALHPSQTAFQWPVLIASSLAKNGKDSTDYY